MVDEVGDLDRDQLDLLQQFEDGLAAAAVAERRGWTIARLSEQLVTIRARLGVDSTAAAVKVARTRGLL